MCPFIFHVAGLTWTIPPQWFILMVFFAGAGIGATVTFTWLTARMTALYEQQNGPHAEMETKA